MKHLILSLLICILAGAAFSQSKFSIRQLTNESVQQGFPSWSPDGKYLTFQQTDMQDSSGTNGLWKLDFDDLSCKQIFSGLAEHPRWSPDNSFIVFDADTGNNIEMISVNGGAPIEFLPDNINILHGGSPCWSPKGDKLAFLEGSTMSVWVYVLEEKEFTKIYQDENKIPMPGCWSKDGKSILLGVRGKGSYESEMLRVGLDGSIIEKVQGHAENFYRYIDLSPDGKLLVYVAVNLQERSSSIMVMSASGGKSIEVVAPPGSNEAPCWSPDGSKIAFTSTRNGYFNIWVVEIDINTLKKELGIM